MHLKRRLQNMGHFVRICPDRKVHGANMGPTWVLSAPDRTHVAPMNLAISVHLKRLLHNAGDFVAATHELVWYFLAVYF